jgi:RimJ/RimL family protein N-acetyltransferase
MMDGRNHLHRPMNAAPLLSDQVSLVGQSVELRPLMREHAASLLHAAADGELWDMKVTIVPGPATIDAYLDTALAGREAGTVMPFVIVARRSEHDGERVVGSTRFWKIDRVNLKLEIGHTWLGASAQRSGINTEAKYLLLAHAFELMNCVRVQFTTDELNEASRAAILRIGAKQEGIVRHERIMPDGRKRNSVRFSIIDSEWPEVKSMLLRRMRGHERPADLV